MMLDIEYSGLNSAKSNWTIVHLNTLCAQLINVPRTLTVVIRASTIFQALRAELKLKKEGRGSNKDAVFSFLSCV